MAELPFSEMNAFAGFYFTLPSYKLSPIKIYLPEKSVLSSGLSTTVMMLCIGSLLMA
jgi:hypothetical protein